VSLQEGQDRPLPLRPARPTQATTRTTTWSRPRTPSLACPPECSGACLLRPLHRRRQIRSPTIAGGNPPCTTPSNLKALKGEPGCGAPSESDSESSARRRAPAGSSITTQSQGKGCRPECQCRGPPAASDSVLRRVTVTAQPVTVTA
jgi:hypothetical protein